MAILVLAAVLVIFFSLKVLNVIIHNHRAHKFFKTKSPQLPVVPNPNIFVGNIDETIFTPKNCESLGRWHDKLGKTFGHYMTDQPWVSTKDIDLLKKILIDDANKHLDRMFARLPAYTINDSLAQINGDDWHRVRMAIAPTLTNLRVRGSEVSPYMEQVIDQFIGSLERKLDEAEQSTGVRSAVLEVHDYMERIALAIAFSLLYKQDNVIDFNGDKDSWIEEFGKAENSLMNPYVKLMWALPFLSPLVMWLFRFTTFGRSVERVVKFINQTVDLQRAAQERQERMQAKQAVNESPVDRSTKDQTETVSRKRLLDGFVDKLLEKKISMRLFIGTAYFLVVAGYDTTANTATCLLWHLAQNPDIQTRLREAVLKEGIDAEYVVWCIMEIVRWHPAVPLGTGRVLSEDIMTNDGLLIPKGSYVMPSTYSIHHDESIWPDADKFMPERWRYQSKFHPAAFMGFGLGPRNCVGGKMAVHELKLIIRAILTRYRVETCEQTVKQYGFISPGLIYTIPDDPIKLRFVPL